MINKTLLFVGLFVSIVFLVSILGGCSGQPADNTEINKRDTSPKEITTDQRSQSKAYNTGMNERDTSTKDMTADQQSQSKADNTGINKRDTSPNEITADQQSQSKMDREISQKIRQAVVDDESLSIYADNVKIITVDGMVTLKGPVRSEAEKRMIEDKATQIAGMGKVKNEIEIAPENQDN